MSEPLMNTLSEPCDAVWRDRGSKFLAYARRVGQETEIAAFAKEIRLRWPDATHHCLGARWNPDSIMEIGQDDGEPSGTAGLPILNQLRSRKLVNVACIVVRYFGGTKLGKPGLIQAYGTAAAACLDEASLLPIEKKNLFRITTSFTEIKWIEYQVRKSGAKILSTSFTDIIRYELGVPDGSTAEFLSQMQIHGMQRVKIEPLGTTWDHKSA